MKKNSDPYGMALWDYYNKRYDLVEQNGWTTTCERYFEKTDWLDREKEAIKLAKGKILDIGCSAGRHAIFLQNKGFDVLGVDNSPLSIKIAKLRGLKKGKVYSITQLTHRLGIFDTLLLFGANWGLVGTEKRAKWLLRRFKKMTTSNAIILASYPGDNKIDPDTCSNEDIKKQYIFNQKHGKMIGETIRKLKYENHSCNLRWMDCSTDDIDLILKGTGWYRKKTIYDKYAGVAVILKNK